MVTLKRAQNFLKPLSSYGPQFGLTGLSEIHSGFP
jgi:hypothetical protein